MFYNHGLPHRAEMVWRVENCPEKDEKPLEEGSIASVIEEAVVEDTYREKELVEDIEAIHSKAEKRKEK